MFDDEFMGAAAWKGHASCGEWPHQNNTNNPAGIRRERSAGIKLRPAPTSFTAGMLEGLV